MSCQGITSSGITRQGLLDALQLCGPTLQHLCVMTPWLPHTARADEPDFVIDKGLKLCPQLRTLCVAGYDVTNSFIKSLPNPGLIESLEIMDFELVTPQIIFELSSLKADNPFKRLRRLSVWQRNAGVGRARVSNGWFKAMFARSDSPAVIALQRKGILLGTSWESRLISGSPIGRHER